MDSSWDDRADVVVVGFGGAGACAAIEAAEAGADVLVLDRFTGGGATAVSGGVVYAGGGTIIQRQAGVVDTPEEMFAYLSQEAGDVVSATTLRRFCDESAGMIDWLAERGVPFHASLCPYKTSYPNNEYYLYYSGSENAFPFRESAVPAPRGHRAHGPGTSGRVFFAGLVAAARQVGVRVRTQAGAQRLVVDGSGRVVGVECLALSGFPARVHALLYRYATKPGLYVPALARRLWKRITRLERRYRRPYRVAATRGVVLAAGGFIANRDMVREHAPRFRGGLPLGTLGDDGAGIRLGVEAGGATDRMDSVSAWRFLTPPSALLRGILVNQAGKRFIDESRYGAAIGHAMITEQGGAAWLLIDEPILREARRQLRTETLWFQRMQARYLLRFCRVRGTLGEVARRAGIDSVALRSTVDEHGGLSAGPYSLIDCSSRPRLGYPCPMLTLGGLRVDESTGEVRSGEGAPIAGLFAAGRNAVGICSSSYVSGLSLADGVFSGRRAGRGVVRADLARRLRVAERDRAPIDPLTGEHPALSPADAYEIQLLNIGRRAGPVVGHKVGLSSEVMQQMMGVDEPDYGHLLVDMWLPEGVPVDASRYCYPRVEVEVGFVLGDDLPGEGCTERDVLDRTEALAPAIELIDSRIRDWRISLVDTIADNASSAGFVLGAARVRPSDVDVQGIDARLWRNGSVVAEGRSDAVLGNPVIAVAWLARKVAGFGVRLRAGHIVLPGSCTRAIDARPGDEFHAEFAGLGDVDLSFKGS